MQEFDLLTILTNVNNEYIEQAQAMRAGQKTAQLRVMRKKRAILIAAVISLLLLLVGCAAVLAALQKISLGSVTFPQYRQDGWTQQLASLNGYQDSANYQATQEWLSFITSYDPDRVLEQNKDTNGYTAPDEYRDYYCYTPQMQEKVDEICEKYGLTPMGPGYSTLEPDQVFQAVGLSAQAIANRTSTDPLTFVGGSFYRSGSFYMVGDVSHCFAGRSAADSILFVYRCDHKSVFFPDYISLLEQDNLDSWEYTAWDGTKLTLVQGPVRGIIAAQVGDYFFSVTLDFHYSSPDGEVDLNNPCNREDFEWIADAFAYQLSPREPEADWMQHPFGLNAGPVIPTFGDYFDQWMPGSIGSSAYSPDYQQKFLDLDGDGSNEMLIWNAGTGVVYEVVTRVDRELLCVYGGGTYAQDDHETSLYLCEGNVLERDCGDLQGKQLNEYYRLQDHQLIMVETVLLGQDGKYSWSTSGGAAAAMWKEITKAEYEAFRARYVRVDVPQQLSFDRAAELLESGENALLTVLQSRESFTSLATGKSYTLDGYCSEEGARMGLDIAITRYAFVDLDGDGASEAIADFRFGENREVMCMVLKYDSGTVFGVEFYYRQMYQLKEDGSFAYSGGADQSGWGKLRWENQTWTTQEVADSSGKADATWYAYPIAEG